MTNRFLTLLAALGLLAGCSDSPLEVEPTASIPAEEALDDPRELELGVLGTYDALQYSNSMLSGDGTYSRNLVAYPELYADNLTWTGTYTTDQQVSNRDISSSNGAIREIWASAYEAINRANNVLAALPGVEELDEGTAAEYRGEMLFVRALSYFNLVRLFGDVPLLMQPTWEITDGVKLPRDPQAEVYAQIEADLTEAVGLLSSAANPGRATRWAAQALLAKVQAQQARWAQAQASADAVIESGEFGLVADYADLFEVKNTSESIFEVQYSKDDANALAFWFFPRAFGGRRGFAPTADLYAAFPAGDVRRDVTIGLSGTARYGTKYFRVSSGDDNVIVLRLADMYLTRAEASARLGQLAEAIADVNLIRERARLEPLPEDVDTQAEVLAAILAERRLEFALEGHRFFDLKRFGVATTVLGIEPERLLWPIPLREIEVNDALLQNPGY